MHQRDRNRIAVLAILDRDNAHYEHVQRQKQHKLSDMKVVAQAVQRVVVVVPDANGMETPPYYCVPHEAPR